MKLRRTVFLISVMFFCLNGCGLQETNPNTVRYPYVSIYAPDSVGGYLSELAVVDGKLYYQWYQCLEDTYGMPVTEYMNMLNMETGSGWQLVTDTEEIEIAKSHIRSVSNYHPMYEEIGRYILFSDADNNVYIADNATGTQTDLKLNYVDWRCFATDHASYFAVLSSFCTALGGEYVNEIRYYKLG